MVLSIHNHRSFHENRIWLRSDRWREDLQYLSHYVCSTTEYCQEKVSLLFTVLLKGTIKNIQQHFVICHTHTQYRQYLFLKKPDCPSLQNCNLVQIYQRAKNAIKYQVPKQKNRIENFSHTQYDTRVLIPTSQLLFQLNRGGLKSNKVQYQDALLFSSCF